MHTELEEVFLGKKEWKVEGLLPFTSALCERDLPSLFTGPLGVIILAGGRGTRLGMKGPKGCFLVEGKSLFAHLLLKAQKPEVWVAIMTSPDNHAATETYLREQQWFGIERSHIDLFIQPVAPTLSLEGKWLEKKTPAGNGAMFKAFSEHGLLAKWRRMGIEALNVVMIDNPLANPVDTKCPALIEKGIDLVVKSVERKASEEKLGVFTTKEGKLFVEEYFEQSEKEKGNLCNTGMFSCSLDFLERAASYKLPWHLVQKENHFQFETFIFDAFCLANTFAVVLYPRESSFNPIKEMPKQIENCSGIYTDS
jgi:UDP-N-acetylglucosamine/UDP-N-acetylgalactosamine diphosphorylase